MINLKNPLKAIRAKCIDCCCSSGSQNISDNTKIYTFTFAADTDWVPGEAGCWTDCPFAYLLKRGDVCKYIKNKVKCPLVRCKAESK